jgi:RNA polymerase sigma factor (sigma-70 family)
VKQPTHDRQQWIRQAVEQYERPLVLYAWRLTMNLELAREVVQDTFLKLCDQTPEDIQDHLAQWLYTVCRNRSLDVARKEKPMKPLSEPDHLVKDQQTPPPESQLEQAELSQQLAQALSSLPANQQEVIRLKFQHGLSYKDIAKTTQLTTTHVGYLIHVGIKSLRQQLAAQA